MIINAPGLEDSIETIIGKLYVMPKPTLVDLY